MSGPRSVPEPTTETVTQADTRRQVAVVVTVVAAAVLLGLSFAQPAGSTAFYLYTLVLAAVSATGARLSGPIPLGRFPIEGHLRSSAAAIGVGILAGGVFVAGAAIVREIGPLRDYVTDVVTHTHGTSFALILLVTVLNAIAEELLFRGAVYAVASRWRWAPVTTTVVYTAVVAVSGDLALVFAAVVLGGLLAFLRWISGGVLPAILTHVTWSVILLLVLPPLFGH